MAQQKRPKLRPSVKKAWIEALRSGEYQRGRGQLRNGFTNTFCCLGVLCNIHAQQNPEFAKTQLNPSEYDGEASFPSISVVKWAFGKNVDKFGDSDYAAEVWDISNGDYDYDTLYMLNDKTGLPFSVIANIIEKEF